MLIAVIPVKDYPSAKQQIALVGHQADGVELRLDYSPVLDLSAVAALRAEFSLPMIFTLRKKSQGGFYQQDEAQRLQDILALCQLGPDYLDLEYDVPGSFLQELTIHHPWIKFICSYHNFDATPADLMAILQEMKRPGFYAYKMATKANKTLDALRMLQFIKTFHQQYVLTGICMGEEGQCTRILSPIVGNAMNYASLGEANATAPGQLTLNALLTVYRLRKLNSASKIYALLGDPVHLSIGHIFHNRVMELLQENAVYIKLRVTQEELPQVIDQCRRLPFAGFSITMPLKEAILPLLDEIDPTSQPIRAINTIVKRQEKYLGFNTDGKGAIQVLAERVDLAKQKIVILGAGGAARAIVYEALQHKAEVIVLNRTLNKAKKLAAELGCEGNDLSKVQCLKEMRYTVLINTLPEHVYAGSPQAWLRPEHLLPHTFALDIVYRPTQTTFLQIAEKANAICIAGYEMYVNQAHLQIQRWYQKAYI